MKYEIVCHTEGGSEVMTAGGYVWGSRAEAEKVAASRIGETWGGKVIARAKIIERNELSPPRVFNQLPNNDGGGGEAA